MNCNCNCERQHTEIRRMFAERFRTMHREEIAIDTKSAALGIFRYSNETKDQEVSSVKGTTSALIQGG